MQRPRSARWPGFVAISIAAALSGCGNLQFGNDDPPSGGTASIDDDDDTADDRECCTPHDGPECDNPIVSTCVCEHEPACCEDVWDERCAGLVVSEGCGLCGAPGTCCTEHDTPGCEVPALEACVCTYDPACCQSDWDAQCVADVFLFGCGMCPGVADCCVADGAPGCSDPGVQACVCAEEPRCCAEGWDFTCVQAVEAHGCGTCSADASSG